MKKLTALLLCLLLLAGCMSALAVEPDDVTGDWYMSSTERNGQTYTVRELGFEIHLTLNPDGTGAMANVGRQTLSGTWTLEDDTVILANGDKIIAKYICENGELRVEEPTMVIRFGREVSSLRPTPVEAQRAEDFYGIYQLDFFFDDEKWVAAEDLGVEASFVITKDGMITMDEFGQAVSLTYGFTSSGKLAVTDGVSLMAVVLNEDGSITIRQSGTMNMCLRRVQE